MPKNAQHTIDDTPARTALFYADEESCVRDLLRQLDWPDTRAHAVQTKAQDLVLRLRARKIPPGQLESFLQQFSLNTEEGLALMGLAEALLRIPDAGTRNALIRDKIAAASWARSRAAGDWVVRAAGLGLVMTRKTLNSALAQIGQPFIREAMLQGVRRMGSQFVLGEDIESAVQNAQAYEKRGYRISYDILGEGARTAADAQRYFESYRHALQYIAQRRSKDGSTEATLSVKLSALHPRYSHAHKEQCVPALVERLTALCLIAAQHGIRLTVDAEEADRLELSLDIFTQVLDDARLAVWDGFGLAVQAYQKRAPAVVDHIVALAKARHRRLHIRLVKGAYWDSEIKRAQVLGLPEYPVYTRKSHTDLSYLCCAQKMLQAGGLIDCLFGTHNAHTVAAIAAMAQDYKTPFEFQCLHGMAERLYDTVLEDKIAPVGIYAPVGPQADLLAYLARRLLENGANSSFLNRLNDPDAPVDEIVRDPVDNVRASASLRHPFIALPKDLYAREEPAGRRNSQGVELHDAALPARLLRDIAAQDRRYDAPSLIGGAFYKDAIAIEIRNPADLSEIVGRFWPAPKGLADKAFRIAGEAFPEWSRSKAADRAECLERAADLFEAHRAELMALCVREAGKTLPDALAEIREAVDFLRYYANRGRADFAAHGQSMPGPTGESNVLSLHGRGTFVCISPWNFPLAIFTGQVSAALMAGNCVIAKPAEQTPLIALRAVQLLHEAGIPVNVLHLLPGDGRTGAALVGHPDVAGVAFTGSTDVAREINMALSVRRGPIVPLIAETGGQNALIVDSSALPEQVIDDALLSAFGSAGQRCSALRVLFLQDDCAETVLRLLRGAMAELTVGDPGLLSTDIGPVIDQEALTSLVHHRENLKGFGRIIGEVPLEPGLSRQGYFFAPGAWEIPHLRALNKEVFGPMLHVIRYRRGEIDDVIAQVNATGYGLTLGVHSRIAAFHDDIAQRVRAGNVYVNRSMIGAVVGTQPFGGQGLSGTGPKAGGPHYLPRFATEKSLSINTAAAGGNAGLVSLEE